MNKKDKEEALKREENIEKYNRYEQIRKERGLSNYQVAKKMEIGTAMFTHWKQGKYSPKIEKMQQISNILGVSVDYLMGNTEIREVVYDYDNEPLMRAASRLAEKDSNAKQLLNKRIREQINISDYEYNLIIAYRKATEGVRESVDILLKMPVAEEKKA